MDQPDRIRADALMQRRGRGRGDRPPRPNTAATLAIGWRQDEESPVVQAFVETPRSLLGSSG